jgi:hypothetical protein
MSTSLSPLLAPMLSSAKMRAVCDDATFLQNMLDFEAALARAEAATGVIFPAAASTGRPTAAFARGLECFGDVRLHHERDVARDLPAGAGNDCEGGGRVSDAVAMGVPWRLRQRQIEFLCQLFGNCRPQVAERGQGAGSATKLQHQRHLAQAS